MSCLNSPRSSRASIIRACLLGKRSIRQHRAAEGLFQRLGEVVLAFDPDVEAAVLLGQAFGIEEALLARPAFPLTA